MDKNITLDGAMPADTKKILNLIAEGRELESFALVGGTGLAIYLKHRISEDLDFFANRDVLDDFQKNKIKNLVSRLRDNGVPCRELKIDSYDICHDYMFGGVKVTFLAADMKVLDSSVKYKNMNIASIDQIAAMKMQTILRYRIKSRDFYDVKCLITDAGYTFGSLIDVMVDKFGFTNDSEDRIEKRFLGTPLSPNDEGLSTLSLKYAENFGSLRSFFKKEILAVHNKSIYLNNMTNDELIKNVNEKIGLRRELALAKMLSYGMESKIYSLDLGKYCDDPLAQDINGYSIIDQIGNNPKLLEYVLFHTKVLSGDIAKKLDHLGKPELLDILERHRLLNRCLDKSDDRVEKILEGKNIDREKFLNELSKKRERFGISNSSVIFKNIFDKKKEENSAKIDYN
jgi:domain of unknown function (DUF1814)